MNFVSKLGCTVGVATVLASSHASSADSLPPAKARSTSRARPTRTPDVPRLRASGRSKSARGRATKRRARRIREPPPLTAAQAGEFATLSKNVPWSRVTPDAPKSTRLRVSLVRPERTGLQSDWADFSDNCRKISKEIPGGPRLEFEDCDPGYLEFLLQPPASGTTLMVCRVQTYTSDRSWSLEHIGSPVALTASDNGYLVFIVETSASWTSFELRGPKHAWRFFGCDAWSA